MDLLFHNGFPLKSTLPWGIELLLCQNVRHNICAAEQFVRDSKGVTGAQVTVLDKCTAAEPLKYVPAKKFKL